MRRKILMGVLALALPVGTLAVTQTAAVAKKPPPNPVYCSGFGGTVDFASPGLSVAGSTNTSKTSVTSVSDVTVGTCSLGTAPGGTVVNGGNSGPSSLTITSKSTKNPKVHGQPKTYSYGTFASFASTGGASIKKSLKSLSFTVGGSPVTIKVSTANEVLGSGGPGNCAAGEVGFDLVGQVKAGTYTDKTSAQVLACFDATSGGLLLAGILSNDDCNTVGGTAPDCVNGYLAQGNIDPTTSFAIL